MNKPPSPPPGMSFQDLTVFYQHREMAGIHDRYFCDIDIYGGRGWGEGVPIFWAHTRPHSRLNTVPVYRHKANGDNNTVCYNHQEQATGGWQKGELLCHVYKDKQPDSDALYAHLAHNPDRGYLDFIEDNAWGWNKGQLLGYAYKYDMSLVEEIRSVLGWQGHQYNGVTYMDTSHNGFTLLDTPGCWNGSPTVSQPTAACTKLFDAITRTIASAHTIVDITTMWKTGSGLPWGGSVGGFEKAIHDGLKALVKSSRKPLVRIAVGAPPVAGSNSILLENTIRKLVTLGGDLQLSDIKFPMQIAICTPGTVSWNHSKIVAADGVRAVVGGHNLWDDYFNAFPVHDVSGLIEGMAAYSAHRFCDYIWSKVSAIPGILLLENGKLHFSLHGHNRPQMSALHGTSGGNLRMLSLGRLGDGLINELTEASNASVSARIMAICRAKKHIRISQQSLYCMIVGAGGFDFYTMWALVKAMKAGVNVDIVVSNDTTMSDGGYIGDLRTVLHALTWLYVAHWHNTYKPSPDPERGNLLGWAQASLKPPFSYITGQVASRDLYLRDWTKPIEELNARLNIASLCFAKDVNYWQVGNERHPAANHAKVYIIDDTHFYVGSDNMYMSASVHGLQEYGYLMEGQPETQAFINDYWNKIWEHSKATVVKAKKPANTEQPLTAA